MDKVPHGLVSGRVLIALAAAARALEIDIDLAALAPTLHAKGEDALVPTGEHFAVARAILADPRETLGIELAQALPLEVTGLWGFLLRSSVTFGEMLHRAERYMRIANHYEEFVLEERGEWIAMVCPHPAPSPYDHREQVVTVYLGHWIAWGRQLTQASINVQEAHFRWTGPRDRAPFERFFGGRVRFGAEEDMLLLPRELLELPLPERTPELSEQFEAYATALLRRMRPEPGLVDRVREALLEGLLIGTATEAGVSRRLAMTPRTLHRRLGASGTSFRKVRDQLLRQRAEELLREHRLPIAEVAYLLGYAESSNFHRAVRRWTGVTPTAWRERL